MTAKTKKTSGSVGSKNSRAKTKAASAKKAQPKKAKQATRPPIRKSMIKLVGADARFEAVFGQVAAAVATVGAWDFAIDVELHKSFDAVSDQQAHKDSPAMYVGGSRPRRLLINETLFFACSPELQVAVLLHEIGHAVRDPLPKEPLAIGMPSASEEALADLFVAQCGHGAALAEDRRQHWLDKGWGQKNADEYAACLRDPGDDVEAAKNRLRKVCWKVQIGQRE